MLLASEEKFSNQGIVNTMDKSSQVKSIFI